jgi:salicylate hydroxylase
MLPHHGQGAGQAIEDAAALAHCLDTATRAGTGTRTALREPSGTAEGLARYEAIRRPHTTRVQLGARGGGSLRLRRPGPETPDGAGLASLVDDVSWIHRYDVEEALGRG